MALEDLRKAADLFRPTWEETGGRDGYVSVEVPPDLAYEATATVALALRLHDQAALPNLLVKIPGTPPGLTAMEEAVVAGVGANMTLLFSDTHYLQSAEAYLRALERRHAAGQALDIPSVGRFRLSCRDSAADPLLPRELHGKLGLAMSQKVYSSYQALLAGERWQVQAARGPARSVFCGRRHRSRTRHFPIRITPAVWPCPIPSIQCRRRPSWPSPTTAHLKACSSPTMARPNGSSQQ